MDKSPWFASDLSILEYIVLRNRSLISRAFYFLYFWLTDSPEWFFRFFSDLWAICLTKLTKRKKDCLSVSRYRTRSEYEFTYNGVPLGHCWFCYKPMLLLNISDPSFVIHQHSLDSLNRFWLPQHPRTIEKIPQFNQYLPNTFYSRG